MSARFLLRAILLAFLLGFSVVSVVAGTRWGLIVGCFSILSACASAVWFRNRPLLAGAVAIGVGALIATILSPPPAPEATLIGALLGTWGWAWTALLHDASDARTGITEPAGVRGMRALQLAVGILFGGPLIGILLLGIGGLIFGIDDGWLYLRAFPAIGAIVGAVVAFPYFTLALIWLLRRNDTTQNDRANRT